MGKKWAGKGKARKKGRQNRKRDRRNPLKAKKKNDESTYNIKLDKYRKKKALAKETRSQSETKRNDEKGGWGGRRSKGGGGYAHSRH